MGDLLTLIEKAAAAVDQEKAEKMASKLKEAEFTLEDFLEQIQQMKDMGPIDQLIGMIPGLGGAMGVTADLESIGLREIVSLSLHRDAGAVEPECQLASDPVITEGDGLLVGLAKVGHDAVHLSCQPGSFCTRRHHRAEALELAGLPGDVQGFVKQPG